MNWLILSLLTALAVSTQDAWVKKFFSHLSAYHMVAYPALYSLPLFTAGLCFIERPPLDGVYFWCLLISLPLNGVSFVLYMRAIKISPLSLTLPYLAFFAAFNFIFLLLLPVLRVIRLEIYARVSVKGLIAGILFFLQAVFHGSAISLTKAAYMISLKRLSILFGVLYGAVVFKEQNIGIRLIGATLMLSGSVLIVLKGG